MDKQKLFQLPQAPSNATEVQPAPAGAREQEQALAERAASTPSTAEQASAAHVAGRDYAARTKTVRQKAFMRLVGYALGGAALALSFGAPVGLFFAAVATMTTEGK